VRISFGKDNTLEEASMAAEAISAKIRELRGSRT
jgi:cysteine sulfinate desulfinase/cysteine desulfurase-like protein